MMQEDSIYISSQHNTLISPTGNGSITHYYIENGVLHSFSQEDILYSESQKALLSLDSMYKNLPRFFVEKGKVDLMEIERLDYQKIPLWINQSIFFWVLVAVLARHIFWFRLRQIIIATINPKQVKLFLREGNMFKQAFPILLLFLYPFTLSLFAFLNINLHTKSFYFSSGEGFLILLTAVIFYQLLKLSIILFLGLMFDTHQISMRYLLDHYLFHISEGIFLFPLLILFVYSGLQVFVYLAIILLIALWLFRLQRAIVIGLANTNFSPSYLFLYLCTLEVLPFFLLYKLGLQFV